MMLIHRDKSVASYCTIVEGLWMDKYVVALYVEGSLVLAQSMCVLNVG